MLWIILALLLALPVLLGLVPGSDATGAQRLVVRCCIAGGFVGLLGGAFILVASPNSRFAAALILPGLQGLLIGAGIGLFSVVIRRFLAGRRT
jgi:hypothetical protein